MISGKNLDCTYWHGAPESRTSCPRSLHHWVQLAMGDEKILGDIWAVSAPFDVSRHHQAFAATPPPLHFSLASFGIVWPARDVCYCHPLSVQHSFLLGMGPNHHHGASIYDVHIFLGFFWPPLCPQHLFWLSANLLHFLSPSPFSADVIYGSPLPLIDLVKKKAIIEPVGEPPYMT